MRVASKLSMFVLLCILLNACSDKPPGCSDPQTVGVMREVVLDSLEKNQRGDPWVPFEVISANDPAGLWSKFKTDLTLHLNNVTTDGYDSASKRHTCEASLDVSEGKLAFTMPVKYSTQAVEGEDGKFMLRTSDLEPVTMNIRNEGWSYWRTGRFGGEWTGQLTCDGLDGETNGAKGPFAMPVSATVDKDLRVEMKRDTRGGGTESLAGSVDETGKLGLRGRGANSPNDEWSATYDGEIKGNSLAATGSITAAGAESTRSCRLALQHVRQDGAQAGGSGR